MERGVNGVRSVSGLLPCPMTAGLRPFKLNCFFLFFIRNLHPFHFGLGLNGHRASSGSGNNRQA